MNRFLWTAWARPLLFAALPASFAVGCSDAGSPPSGEQSSGGAGAPTGGTSATGGRDGGASGGTASTTGGAAASGGASVAGAGGVLATGGAAGGSGTATGSGGAATGGAVTSGGAGGSEEPDATVCQFPIVGVEGAPACTSSACKSAEGYEIRISTADGFYIGHLIWVLNACSRQFHRSGSADSRSLRFLLTEDEFQALPEGLVVSAFYGTPGSLSGSRPTHCGMLDTAATPACP